MIKYTINNKYSIFYRSKQTIIRIDNKKLIITLT